MGASLYELNMPEPFPLLTIFSDFANKVIGYAAHDTNNERNQCENMKIQLNSAQRRIFDRVEQALLNNESCQIYVHGPGGSGKTFLYKALCHLVRSRDQSVLATAWTGIAASLLQDSSTCHSRFGLPVPFNSLSTSRISADSPRALVIRNAHVILGDEASMMPGDFVVELDRLLRDFTGLELIFGGKIVLLSGDMRQTLPVLPGKTETEVFDFVKLLK